MFISSASPRQGKTTTTANLAAVFAQTGQRVIVVDSDLRRPTLHEIFGIGNGAGLTNALLTQDPEPPRFLQPTLYENLSLLASGPQPPNPSELLSSDRMDAVIAALRKEADIVLFDSLPLLAVADASILAAKVDGTILVVDAGRTRAPALQGAAEALSRTGAKAMGAILNKLPKSGHGYYAYSYYYSSPESATSGHRKRGIPFMRPPRSPEESKTHA